jgi:retron-type reverse transcriptase
MNCLPLVWDIENLHRAWRWIRSNPDAQYKAYFRPLYSAFAISADRLLDDLGDRLKRGIYQPSPARKILLPKPSGALRPYTLLTVEDQVAYQAAVNVVAEQFTKRVRHRYYGEVFGNLYAGKANVWFYRKWSKGYKAFNNACRDAFKHGFQHAASFDLTACYDSIDHGVLRHFLQSYGCDAAFCKTLTTWLSMWTSTDRNIFHNHGIPQGPLSSGLLAEVVLQHFDDNRGKPKRVRYLRYVDDIRLFSKSEADLRRMLVKLDKLSKDIGVFPQTSKIEIHEVSDIEDELKSVSHPTEDAIRSKTVNQKKLRARVVTLSKGYKVPNPTRFRYVLAHATPHSSITNRLWRIYAGYPEMYPSIIRYLQRYQKFPESVNRQIAIRIQDDPLYPAVTAAFIEAANSRMRGRYKSEALKKIRGLWRPKSLQDDLLVAAGRWLMAEGRLTYGQIKYACTGLRSWWARANMVLSIDLIKIGRPSFENLANLALRDTSNDVSLAAAMVALAKNVTIKGPAWDINRFGRMTLRQGGALHRGPGAVCGIHESLVRMLGTVTVVNWRKFFGADYKKIERQAVCIAGYHDTDVTSWVNAMDVFDDWLLNALHRNDSTLGPYALGNIGGSIKHRRRNQKYPAVSALVKGIHARRYESNLSHAVQLQTGKPTGPIRWSYFKTGRRLLAAAISELAQHW